MDQGAALRSLGTLILLIAYFFLPPWVLAATEGREYRLNLYHSHTGERLDIVYRRGDSYLPGSIIRLDHFLRDHRTGDVHQFDPHLFDLLHDLGGAIGRPEGIIDIVCGISKPVEQCVSSTHQCGCRRA